jgi:hypothetical protein
MRHAHDPLIILPKSVRSSTIVFSSCALPPTARPTDEPWLASTTPDPLMPWRVLTYQQRIWAAVLRVEPARRRLPAIVTIVVHHGEGGWNAPRRFHELSGPASEDLLIVMRYIGRVAGATSYDALRRQLVTAVPAIEETMATFDDYMIEKGVS